ncbi:hypothetical protein [Xanthomonas vesicatoria]|uniref:Uncharacterized protein n=1 Tax=Xanthomonas vesicatoria TaxID=56460 RepID=A0ABS8L5I4_9XANT|nr:hypothetical protein [Xanthomonas vesicatoria]APO93309.1 hypothetical protein BI313_00660 [Xanthomonas vesicatoria]MCC8620512.1 hypothetical protein [Xanthomonas vesicatoria]MCC8633028.1 hypothetical protein [Xanthomonas vesicatoria]MDG4491473.1 hypothetical protein [Xanthomonas vesicatoria]
MPHDPRHAVGATAVGLLGACLAWNALAGPAAGGSWATVAGYYPGMPKEAARKVGLSDCAARYQTVECKATQPLKIGGATSTASTITLEEDTGRVATVEFQFQREAYAALADALVAQLGKPTAKDGDYQAREWTSAGRGACVDVLVWHRGGDEALALCGPGWRRTGVTYLVADRQAGRGNAWTKLATARAKSAQTADSFNSK